LNHSEKILTHSIFLTSINRPFACYILFSNQNVIILTKTKFVQCTHSRIYRITNRTQNIQLDGGKSDTNWLFNDWINCLRTTKTLKLIANLWLILEKEYLNYLKIYIFLRQLGMYWCLISKNDNKSVKVLMRKWMKIDLFHTSITIEKTQLIYRQQS
jgi:hypothetical protein